MAPMRAKSSFTSSSDGGAAIAERPNGVRGRWPRGLRRLLHSGLGLAVVIAVGLECTVFPQAFMLADRSTVAIVFKARQLEAHRNDNIIILGPSTAMAIDAASLALGRRANVRIYNFALPNLGSPDQYYFVLKRYLEWNRRPDLVLLALPPDSIVDESSDGTDQYVAEVERQRFRRFFGPGFLLPSVMPATRQWSRALDALVGVVPSLNYRVFIKNSTFAPELDEIADRDAGASAASIYRRNEAIVARLASTHGQLVYNGYRVVSPDEIARTLGPAPEVDTRMARSVERTIALAEASGISVTLFFTPVSDERGQWLDENGTWATLADLMHQYEATYPSFRFLDTRDRVYDRTYFGDPVHLNEHGAARFSADLRARPDLFLPGNRDAGVR